jgi:hypothetical protein
MVARMTRKPAADRMPKNPRVRLTAQSYPKWQALVAKYGIEWTVLADRLADDALAGRPFNPVRTD